jgi:5-methylcytosine-specific restriction endonuclease McrA
MGGDVWLAVCHVCGKPKVLPVREWWADHIVPVVQGGHECGALRLSCASCQRKQGARVAHRVR